METAAIVINAQNGIEMMTGRFMQWAAKRGLDRLVIVNRIDADNVGPRRLLERIQQAFGKECLPLNLPAAKATRVSDCFFAPAGEVGLLLGRRGAPAAWSTRWSRWTRS